jgi:hypothetical protein
LIPKRVLLTSEGYQVSSDLFVAFSRASLRVWTVISCNLRFLVPFKDEANVGTQDLCRAAWNFSSLQVFCLILGGSANIGRFIIFSVEPGCKPRLGIVQAFSVVYKHP